MRIYFWEKVLIRNIFEQENLYIWREFYQSSFTAPLDLLFIYFLIIWYWARIFQMRIYFWEKVLIHNIFEWEKLYISIEFHCAIGFIFIFFDSTYDIEWEFFKWEFIFEKKFWYMIFLSENLYWVLLRHLVRDLIFYFFFGMIKFWWEKSLCMWEFDRSQSLNF